MATKVVEDRSPEKRRADALATIEQYPPPYRAGTPTGLTTEQQWALYYSRKRRHQRQGLVPQPPLP